MALITDAALLAACGGGDEEETPKSTAARTAAATPVASLDESAFRLESEAFEEGQPIPVRYTCEGDNASPALSWGLTPDGTQSFTLIVDDPDAPGGTFTHWLLYDLPAMPHSLPQGVETGEQPPTGGIQGRNDGNRIGYTGPCPPEGQTHRYVFTVYALDADLGLEPGASKVEVEGAIEGHVVAEASLTGTFER